MKKVGILDIGYGNIDSVIGSLKTIKVPAARVKSPQAVLDAEVLILPGVGTFGTAMELLTKTEIAAAIARRHQDNQVTLGICLGFQVMSRRSMEAPDIEGLGIFNFEFERLPRPQIGWKSVSSKSMSGLTLDHFYYFNHTYGSNASSDDQFEVARTSDGLLALASTGRTMGTQFHPEKSQKTGKAFLSWFLEDCAK